MKQTIVKLLLLTLSLCMVCTAMVACNEEKPEPPVVDEVETQDSDEKYSFPDKIELNDGELNIFNFDYYYNAIIYTDVDGYSGDKIAEAVYERNAYFSDKYGIDVVEEKMAFTHRAAAFQESTTKISAAHMGGTALYDIAYVSLNEQYTLIDSGMLLKLSEIPTLNLNAEWWDPQLSSSYILKDGACYVASSPLNLMPYELTWLVFFNRDMVTQRGLPDLFDYVRNGEWTIENMLRLILENGIINENSIGGYVFDPSETATYGIAVHSAGAPKLLTGFELNFIQDRDHDTIPYQFACNNTEDFTKANEWLLRMFDRSTGMAIGSDFEDDPNGHPEGYVPIFQSGRSLFLHAELKSGMTMKKILNSEVNYGMLPQPKLNTEQKNYYTTTGASVMLLGIPFINLQEAEAIGAAADVLSYLSYRDVLPVYYNDYVSFRNVSDPDSLDMLNNYIMPGRRLEIGVAYGWTSEFTSEYASLIYNMGASTTGVTLANIISTKTRKINTMINKFFTGN